MFQLYLVDFFETPVVVKNSTIVYFLILPLNGSYALHRVLYINLLGIKCFSFFLLGNKSAEELFSNHEFVITVIFIFGLILALIIKVFEYF